MTSSGQVRAGRLPSVSVIVCTIGRLEALKFCLQALSEQTYRPLEIIAVLDGGSAEAGVFLSADRDIRLVTIDRRNVSAARNAGVTLARGEVVAFCDDDAVPEPTWLASLAAALEDEKVAGCGGKVIDVRRSPPVTSFENGIIRLSGRQRRVRPEPGDCNDATGPWYNSVPGGSCAFRRDALEAVGGFDEFIEFSYDEADVCVRLIQSGRRIVHAPGAVVRHGASPGGFREDELVRDWHVEFKNQLYFGLKNRTGPGSALRTIGRTFARACLLSVQLIGAALVGRVAITQAARLQHDIWRGVTAGLDVGLRTTARARQVT